MQGHSQARARLLHTLGLVSRAGRVAISLALLDGPESYRGFFSGAAERSLQWLGSASILLTRVVLIFISSL